MNLVAQTIDGMNRSEKITITEISVFVDHCGPWAPDENSLEALLKDAKRSFRMTIAPEGNIDAVGDTPLYSNGEMDVDRLFLDDKVIWSSSQAWHEKNRMGPMVWGQN